MKEGLRQLANPSQTPYSKGEEIFMGAEPGGGENMPQEPIKPEDAVGRFQELSRQREQAGDQSPPVSAEKPQGAEDSEEASRPVQSNPESLSQAGYFIDKTGITSGSLLRELDAIASLAGLRDKEEILVDSLQRISVIEEDVTRDEKEKFRKEKEIVIERIRRKAFEAKSEKLIEMRKNYRPQGLYGERKLTENEKEQIKNARSPEDIEKLFNRMFDRVDSRPQADFQTAFGSIGAFEHDEFVKTLNEAITENKEIGDRFMLDSEGRSTRATGTGRARELTLIVQQFANERAARETIHNAYYGVLAGVNTGKLSEFIDSFQSGWADMAFSKKGVTQAMHFYEQALLVARESAGGYLKPMEVVGEMRTNSEGKVNGFARDLLNKANEKGSLVVDDKGNPILDKQGKVRQLEPWQIDRALAFARGMSIITGRTIEIAASSILPSGATAFTDQYAQRIIAELAPFRHMFKFYVSSKFSRVLAYTMTRGRKPWTTKDVEAYDNLKFEEQINVLNAMVPEGKERFYSVLNPLEIGGILSRTGWRVAGGGVTMINDLVSRVKNPDEAWIGTGVQIERKRGDLVRKSKKPEDIQKSNEAEKIVKDQLGKIAERTPLRLFLNIRDVQNAVIDGYLKSVGIHVDGLAKNNPKELNDLRLKQIEKIQPNLNELILLQERANQIQQPLDTIMSEVSDVTKDFVSKIREVWNNGEKDRFLKTLKNKEWATPYTFGADDVPYDQYSFETTGMRSVARRWGDMASAAKASEALGEFVSKGMEHFTNQEQIVEALRKVYDGIKGYNEDDAKKFVLRMAEGVMKFYGKDYKARLPFGIGTLMGMITGKSSYAQIAYGRGAMAWDELQLNEFTRLLRNNGMLTVEQQHELQNKAGGGKKEVSWGYARTVIPLLSLALAYYILSQIMEEKR